MARRDYFEVLDAKVMIVAASRFDQKWVWQKKKPLWAHERALIIIASMVLSIISVTCVGERERALTTAAQHVAFPIIVHV